MKSNRQLLVNLNMLLLVFMLFIGCAKDNLILNTYAPPEQMDKVKELMAKTTSNISYLDVYINDTDRDIKKILNGKTDDRSVAEMLISNVKAYLTQTNFIGINQNEDSNTISLEMKLVSYTYDTSIANRIKAHLEVAFSFVKDETSRPIFSPVYKATIIRSSANGQGLPTKTEILSELTKEIAADLVMDISPTKSRKLVELLPLPKEIAYTIRYAKMGNFSGAIEVMKKFKGEKTYKFYYDLAVYYEGLASSTSNINLLSLANKYYEKSIAMGGIDNEIVIKTKAKFDNFYNLIKAIDSQKKANKKAEQLIDKEINF